MSETTFSDAAFLERLRSRDRAAWEQIVELYLPQLLRAGRSMGFSREENEDLAQSVFTALMQGLIVSRDAPIFVLISSTFFITRFPNISAKSTGHTNTIPSIRWCKSRFDARGRWRQPPVDLDRQIFGRELAEMVQDCLEELPRAQRIVFYLREFEEMTTAEICKKLDISVTNLGILLFRARNRLRECVERKGVRKGTRV
jgi:RNA polymerase sigma-70 factor (ECF subfamily)